MEVLLVFVLGVSIGVIYTIFMTNKRLSDKTSGTIKIETSDPDGPFMFLELRENLSTMIDRKSILLNVEVIKDIPHE